MPYISVHASLSPLSTAKTLSLRQQYIRIHGCKLDYARDRFPIEERRKAAHRQRNMSNLFVMIKQEVDRSTITEHAPGGLNAFHRCQYRLNSSLLAKVLQQFREKLWAALCGKIIGLPLSKVIHCQSWL